MAQLRSAGHATSGTAHSGGGPHAEDNLVAEIKRLGWRDCVVCVYLTKSPCTSTPRDGFPATGKGCAEMLMAFARERNIRFQFLVRNYYQPALKDADKASVAACNAMYDTGMFAFSVEKAPRSNLGKALAQNFTNAIGAHADADGFYIVRAPHGNDLGDDVGGFKS